MVAYALLVAAVGVERVAELLVARSNAAWARNRDGREHGAEHYPWMVALHVGLLCGCILETWALRRPFQSWLGWPMLTLLALSQALRWWCIVTLGRRWNTRVIVVPGLAPIEDGPYRWLRHPNYLAVAVEGAALPLVHSAWVTALLFTMGNAALMARRIPVEEAALAWAAARGAR